MFVKIKEYSTSIHNLGSNWFKLYLFLFTSIQFLSLKKTVNIDIRGF